MDIKDFRFKLSYKSGGKESSLELNGNEIAGGFKNDDLSLREDGNDGRLHMTITTSKPVELLSAIVIYDRYYKKDDAVYANGFQSWTVSREYKRGEQQRGLSAICHLPLARDFAAASGDYFFTQYGKDLYHSYTYTYVRNGSEVELIGSLNERTGYTVFYADLRENVLAAVKDVDGLTVNGEYELFDFVLCTGGYDEAFDAYFAAYPRKHTGRVKHFAGYTSWYNYYQNITEEIILRDLEGLKRAGESANIFQIDDGYETMVGDWDIDERKFPNGLAPIVQKIHAQGLQAGLWLAPFSAQFKAKIVKEHPDWLIKNKKGKPVISGMAWGGFYAFDFELPAVREYIRGLFAKIFNEWGFDMVKLDFLYSTAIYPRNNKTRGQLMCEAMDFLRECCGDKLILGCGVPLGPAFGVVDACRIGCDAETSFRDKFYVKVTNQEIISTRNAMNDSIFRRHLNGRIFANDPDVFFLRDGGMKEAKYSLQQKKLLAKINNMFGSVLFVSDNVGEYGEDMLALLKESYKPFDGKVLSAEYVDGDKIRIDYIQDGAKHTLTFDSRSGESEDKII